MHLKYFFLNEQRLFGLVIIICIAMFIALSVFFVYHLRLVWNNTTTNESFKKDEFNHRLEREYGIIMSLIKETEDWMPKSNEPQDQKMPSLSVDSVMMPEFKTPRLKKLNEYLTNQ